VTKIAIFNLTEEELKDERSIGGITKAVLGVLSDIPGTESKDTSFTFPRDFMKGSRIVSAVITEESFFGGQMNFQFRQEICQQVKESLQSILGRDGREIWVEIRRPK
jgi:hypothetical protein